MKMALVVLAMFPAANALAHAQLQRAEPAVGSRIAAAPASVTLHFSEKLEPRFSSVTVADAAGTRVDKKDLALVPGDAMAVRVGLLPLKPGTYRVTWHAVSVDTHKTQGDFRFTVGAE